MRRQDEEITQNWTLLAKWNPFHNKPFGYLIQNKYDERIKIIFHYLFLLRVFLCDTICLALPSM